ncbi:MAG TPA: RNA polymerase sigma-70 factor [Leeuwenhoekiella sp.]|nr:RNA polymerase sigma-70 factor [Leeuwenhoekiella sp.]
MKSAYNQIPCGELASLLYKGDRHAFDAIFERYYNRIYSYAYRIHSSEQICEDIVQEIFINIWVKRRDTQISNLEGYLFRAVKYKIATHLRNLKFTHVQEEIIQNIPVSAKGEKRLEYEDFQRFLNEQIEKLAPRCRNVFVLSRFEHYSNVEIAAKLDISIRTVEKHISVALKELRRRLSPYHLGALITLLFT